MNIRVFNDGEEIDDNVKIIQVIKIEELDSSHYCCYRIVCLVENIEN